MDGKLNFLIRGKSELTRQRHQIDVLLKRAMKGDRRAKDKLFKEFSIRLYSTNEVENYVKKKLKTEEVEDSPLRVRAKGNAKALPRRERQLIRKG